ncbi:peptide synthetase [Pigmentiphaga sp. NML080357]|uniref:amino acid synthesis family protein n=1 Tax=Pigmentiphaga sp. NML080357 TaxID=2008675 RepID=UPI000B40CCAA|nr:amino acid synthesis family protein [Pigmentiphaga sp. NML080357]OVZ57260.1 peptide synthetase [Pigmentiphaga sp. NML080357]
MQLKVRRWQAVLEEKLEEAGRIADGPLRKAAIIAFVENPYAGRYVEDLSPMIEASPELGARMAAKLREAYGDHPVLSYGKAGVVGLGGEQEHANALLTTPAAEPLRREIGGGKAWISSVTKVGGPGTVLDVPLASKDALYVRALYNAMTLYFPDGPLPDEIALVFAVSNRERLNARVGGLQLKDVQGKDGLI